MPLGCRGRAAIARISGYGLRFTDDFVLRIYPNMSKRLFPSIVSARPNSFAVASFYN